MSPARLLFPNNLPDTREIVTTKITKQANVNRRDRVMLWFSIVVIHESLLPRISLLAGYFRYAGTCQDDIICIRIRIVTACCVRFIYNLEMPVYLFENAETTRHKLEEDGRMISMRVIVGVITV